MYLYAMTALAHEQIDATALKSVLEGDIKQAKRLAQKHVEDERRLADPALYQQWATLCGDLALAQERDEDAELNYRRALRGAAGGTRGQTRVTSCRNTGFMSLHHQRFGIASASFQRVIADKASSPARKVEALCGLAAAQQGMGDSRCAQITLDAAARCSSNSHSSELIMLTDVWAVDLQVQYAVHSNSALQDHIFWRTSATSGAQNRGGQQVMRSVVQCMLTYGDFPLIVQRLRYLKDLLLAAEGDAQALRESQGHLLWLSRAGLKSIERPARLDWAMAALASRNAEVAHEMLEPLCVRELRICTRRWDFELSYCRANLYELQGRTDESLKHYQRYALESVLCLRNEKLTPLASRARDTPPAVNGANDEVEIGLPAKYRRAYRYLLDHLDSADLNVREIAEHIGVTERALQLVFKLHLGMTPAEVMRRCRMERVRVELLAAHETSDTVATIAERWGIRSASTLVSMYRKHFQETPGQTVARGEVALAEPEAAVSGR